MGLGAVIETIALRYEKGKDVLLRKEDITQGVLITEDGIYTGTYMRIAKTPFGYGTMRRFKVNCTEFDFDSLSNATYKGFWLDGQPYGNGILYNGYGDIYSGVFRGYYYISNATVVYCNGDKYQGDISHFRHVGYGRCEGFGEKQYANGDYYYGSFFEGQPNGYGVYTWVDGRTFYGDFCNGYPLLGILNADGINKGVVGYRGNLIDEDEYDDYIKTI